MKNNNKGKWVTEYRMDWIEPFVVMLLGGGLGGIITLIVTAALISAGERVDPSIYLTPLVIFFMIGGFFLGLALGSEERPVRVWKEV